MAVSAKFSGPGSGSHGCTPTRGDPGGAKTYVRGGAPAAGGDAEAEASGGGGDVAAGVGSGGGRAAGACGAGGDGQEQGDATGQGDTAATAT